MGCSAGGVVGDGETSTSGADASADSAHTHTHEGAEGLPPAGDGTSAYEIGYTLRDVRLPGSPGESGRLSFVVEDYRGRPQTEFVEEQTKRMHVYVVRDDLAVFRHVHPQMRPDGTWVGNLTLPEPGDYRVVTEFMARDEGGGGDLVMLGERASVPGEWSAQRPPRPGAAAADWGVEAEVTGPVNAGESEMRIRLNAPDGGAPALGEYLGTSAHLTGFHVGSGAAVHMHPLGAPSTTDDAVELTFHTRLPRPGDYVLFLQVVVEGFLHTLPVPVTAGRAST